MVDRQESRVLSADMLELVLQQPRPLASAVPVAPHAEQAPVPVPVPVPQPGGYELPYAEDFADTALLPDASEGPDGEADAASQSAAAAVKPPAAYAPLHLPRKPRAPASVDADGSADQGVASPSEEGLADEVAAQTSLATAAEAVAPLPSVEFPPLSGDSAWKDSARAAETLPPSGFAEDEDEAAPEAAAADDVSFVKAARRRAFWRKPLVRATLALVWLALLALLAGQVAVYERNRLAAMEPRLRPVLQALCQPLECVLAPQRQISDVVIDSSSFNKARGDSYVLALTMKSRATLALETPAVELTLTDAQDQPVLRRVLLPSEMAAPVELPAGGEWNASVSVLVTTGGARVAGYRLLAFYP
jgi:hypothetical protein